MTLLTFYALFSDDVRIIAFNKDYDNVFYSVTAIGIMLYTVEIFLSCYAQPGYYGHFFFYLDIVSTLSMVPDCGWIWGLFIENSQDTDITTDLIKASRAARTTRIIRVIRVIRLLRIMKLYKQTVLA